MLQNIWSCRHTHLLVLRQMVIMNTFTRDHLPQPLEGSCHKLFRELLPENTNLAGGPPPGRQSSATKKKKIRDTEILAEKEEEVRKGVRVKSKVNKLQQEEYTCLYWGLWHHPGAWCQPQEES